MKFYSGETILKCRGGKKSLNRGPAEYLGLLGVPWITRITLIYMDYSGLFRITRFASIYVDYSRLLRVTLDHFGLLGLLRITQICLDYFRLHGLLRIRPDYSHYRITRVISPSGSAFEVFQLPVQAG